MTHKRHPQAFSLIEVTLALGIGAFVLLSIFALLPMGLTANRNSVNSTIGAGLAANIVADLRAVPRGSASLSPNYNLDPTGGALAPLYLKEDGSAQAREEADYVARVTLTQPTGTGPGVTLVHIEISHPAAAPEPSTSFEAVTAIDRN